MPGYAVTAAVGCWVLARRASTASGAECEQAHTVVVGAGIAGIAAARRMSEVGFGKKVVVLEAAAAPGGHERTMRLPSYDASIAEHCDVDVGFNFGDQGYVNVLRAVNDLSLETVDAPLAASSAQWSNADPTSSRFQTEALRLEGLLSEAESVVPFGIWLRRHGFSDAFVNSTVVPALSVLFLTGRGNLGKPTSMMRSMLGPRGWMGLSQVSAKRIWRVKHGNQQIVDGVVGRYALDLRLNAAVHRVATVPRAGVRVHYGDHGCVDAEYVVFATDAPTTMRIYENPRVGERAMLRYFAKRFVTTYGLLHRSVAMVPNVTTNAAHYHVNGTALSGFLGYENGTRACPYVLSVCDDDDGAATLRTMVGDASLHVEALQWVHPVQELATILLGYVLGLPARVHHPRVRYAGAWTMILGHEHGWRSGAIAAESIMGRNESTPRIT